MSQLEKKSGRDNARVVNADEASDRRPTRKERTFVFAGCALGLVLIAGLFGSKLFSSDQVFDFTGFWIGAKLLGSSKLYNVTANLALQKSLLGKVLPDIIYVRPPFWAVFILPFTLLPYVQAIFVWRVLMMACLAAFVAWFPAVPRRYTALAICWSLPTALAIRIANDAPLELLLIGVSLLLWKDGRPSLVGVALGLCLAKFHFLIFLPLLFYQRRYRKLLIGFAALMAGLVTINFAVQPNWLGLYWQALNLPQENMNAHASLMPNFYASFFWSGHPSLAVGAGALLVGALLWRICQRASFEIALPLCILGGLLVSPHTNPLDGILAIPSFLIVTSRVPNLRLAALFLLSPIAALFYCVGPEGLGPAIFVFTSLGLLWGVWREFARDAPVSPKDAESGDSLTEHARPSRAISNAR